MDYDLGACLDYNPQPDFGKDDIARVLAVWEGENDGDDWRWVLELKDGRFAFLQGWCDYTGWDCQSGATSRIAHTAEAAARFASTGDVPVGTMDEQPGLGRMLAVLTGCYSPVSDDVHAHLVSQLAEGKAETWREAKDRELGVTSGKEL